MYNLVFLLLGYILWPIPVAAYYWIKDWWEYRNWVPVEMAGVGFVDLLREVR